MNPVKLVKLDPLKPDSKVAVMAISVGQPYHDESELEHTLNALIQNDETKTVSTETSQIPKEVIFLVGCKLQRHTLQMENLDLSMDDAEKSSVAKGDEWINKITPTIKKILGMKNIPYRIIRWDDLLTDAAFPENADYIQKFYDEGTARVSANKDGKEKQKIDEGHSKKQAFANAIDTAVLEYVHKVVNTNKKNGAHNDTGHMQAICRRYVLEEISALYMLAKQKKQLLNLKDNEIAALCYPFKKSAVSSSVLEALNIILEGDVNYNFIDIERPQIPAKKRNLSDGKKNNTKQPNTAKSVSIQNNSEGNNQKKGSHNNSPATSINNSPNNTPPSGGSSPDKPSSLATYEYEGEVIKIETLPTLDLNNSMGQGEKLATLGIFSRSNNNVVPIHPSTTPTAAKPIPVPVEQKENHEAIEAVFKALEVVAASKQTNLKTRICAAKTLVGVMEMLDNPVAVANSTDYLQPKPSQVS